MFSVTCQPKGRLLRLLGAERGPLRALDVDDLDVGGHRSIRRHGDMQDDVAQKASGAARADDLQI
jgi:hypothetical protein